MRKSPSEKLVILRNNLKIHLSSHPHDIITVFVIFVKKDYDKIPVNSTVIDIGANIGVFSLYAAYGGAKKVFAYEPNNEAFITMQKNIIENNLEDIIIPHKCGVSGKDHDMIKIPIESSPYNQVLGGDNNMKFEKVGTTTLNSILAYNCLKFVDVLKIDCEGMEYEIFFTMNNSVLTKIKEIRMEFHPGPLEELITYLKERAFEVVYINHDNAVLWVKNHKFV